MVIGKQIRQDLRRWLSPPDSSINHNVARKAHYKGTASWFFQGGIFNKWRSSPSLLWIHGKRILPALPCRHLIHLKYVSLQRALAKAYFGQ
jgi:hypothetical protein